MRKIVLRAFVLLGFTIQACAPLTAATQNVDVKAAMQDVGKRDDPRGQGHQFARYTDTKSKNIGAGDPPKPPQNGALIIHPQGPNLTKNDRTGTAQRRKKHIKLAQESVPARGTCAFCAYDYDKCVPLAIIYLDARIKDEQERKRRAVMQCIRLENKCIKQCK